MRVSPDGTSGLSAGRPELMRVEPKSSPEPEFMRECSAAWRFASSSSWAPWMINSLYGEDMPSLPVGLIWLTVTSAAAIAIVVYKEKKDRENLNSTT